MDIRYAVRVFAFKDNKVACIKYKNINKDYFDIPGGKIEEIKVQNEQEILKREKELSNSAMYSMMGDATKDLFAGIFNSPEFKEEMSKKIKEGFNKK